MSEFDFETEMLDIHVNLSMIGEMRVAWKQAPLGFELVTARVKGANNPAGALVAFIRNGAHLKAEGQHDAAKQQAAMFTCKFCGPLGGTTSDNHYENFPEHRDTKPIPELTYQEVIPWIPPEKRSRQDTIDLHAAIAKRDRGLVRSQAETDAEAGV